jgi:lipid-A-disaccharide synthase
VGRLNFAIARRLVRLGRIGLPNIVAGREVAPELVQDALTPERLSEALAPLLDDPGARSAARAGLELVRRRLGSPGASRRAAALLKGLVD